MLEIKAFRKTKKQSAILQPIKELSERFPKERFIETTEDFYDAVKETKKDYIKFLKKKSSSENVISLKIAL